MATEQCAVCGDTLPFGETVHLLIHTNSEAGVLDHYVCRPCYEDRIADMFLDQESQE